MLSSLREAAKGWIALVFIAMLIVSFGVWGIQDFMVAGSDTSIAKVGDTEIAPRDFNRQYKLLRGQTEERLGNPITDRQAREMRLPRRALDQLMERRAIVETAKGLGLTASQAAIMDELKTQANLSDGAGGIDQNKLRNLLSQNEMNEAALFEAIGDSILQEQIVNTVLTGLRVPAGLFGALNHVRKERRVAEYLLIDPSRTGTIADPDAAALKKFYNDNSGRFRKPEYRAVSFLLASPKATSAKIEVKDEEILRVYDARKSVYVIKEKRQFDQIRFKNEAAAKDGAVRLARGETFEAVAQLQGMKLADIKIGESSEGDPSIPAEAFKTQINTPTAPLKGQFGWIVLRATGVTPGSVKALDEVKVEIRDAIALERARQQILELTNQIEDTLGSGAGIEDAAEKTKLTVQKVAAISKQGRGINNEVIDGLPPDPDFLSHVYGADAGKEGDLLQTADGGYYVLRIDGVTPAALPPLESIKDAVLAEWRREAIAAKLTEIAGDLVKKGNGGKSLADLGSALEMAPLKSPPMGRAEQSEVFSGKFIHDMFEAKVGRFFSGPVGKGQSLIVARLDSVSTVNEPNEVQIEPVFNDRLRQIYGSDVAEIFSKTAQKELNAQVNEKQFQAATEQN